MKPTQVNRATEFTLNPKTVVFRSHQKLSELIDTNSDLLPSDTYLKKVDRSCGRIELGFYRMLPLSIGSPVEKIGSRSN